MNIGYIKQIENPLRIIDKIKYFLGEIKIEQYDQGYVFKVPIRQKEKQIDNIVKKILEKITKLKIDSIVFSDMIVSENLMLYEKVQEKLSANKTNIINGRRLMNYMNFDIWKYILDLQQREMKKEDIFFLIKKEETLELQFLSKFIENCKTVNIVTNDIDRFKKIQENLYEKENILISVSNNKNKSLKRAKYIFNINMDKKDIEKFKINREAIIVNIKENIKYDNNTFAGININYFEIKVPDEYIEQFESIDVMEKFDIVKLYESILMKKIQIEKKKSVMLSKGQLVERKNIVTNILKQDGIKITGLIGNNGRISDKEIAEKYSDSNKNLDKTQ